MNNDVAAAWMSVFLGFFLVLCSTALTITSSVLYDVEPTNGLDLFWIWMQCAATFIANLGFGEAVEKTYKDVAKGEWTIDSAKGSWNSVAIVVTFHSIFFFFFIII